MRDDDQDDADRLAEHPQRVEQRLLLPHQIQAGAVAKMGLCPTLAAGLLGVSDGENDLVGAASQRQVEDVVPRTGNDVAPGIAEREWRRRGKRARIEKLRR